MLAWLFPPEMSTYRRSVRVWAVATGFAQCLSLHELVRKHGQRGFLRVLLRCVSPGIQKAVLHGDLNVDVWKNYLAMLYRSIWCAETCSQQSLVYVCWMSPCRMWYVGKASMVRKHKHGVVESGTVARFVEHITGTVRRNQQAHEYARYRVWNQYYTCDFRSLPVFWDTEQSAFELEDCIIRQLQAPLQQQHHHCRDLRVDVVHINGLGQNSRWRERWSSMLFSTMSDGDA